MEIISRIIAEVTVNPSEIKGLPRTPLNTTTIPGVLQIVFGIAGGIALLIITIAGFRYVVSQGDPQNTAKAKNMILYALIGLVVCIAAWSIIEFVLDQV